MSLAAVLIGVFWAGLTLYAVLGGADFGAGVLQALAPDADARRALAAAASPVWAANHIWLVFFLAGLRTAFPSALSASLLAPGAVALAGIAARLVTRRPLVLAAAGALTPFVFGVTAAGIACDHIALGAFQIDVGLLAVALCTALGATFMPEPIFRRQAAGATTLATALALAGLALAGRPLLDGLSGRGLPAVLAGLAALLIALVALRREPARLARAAIAVAVAALLWGWGLAQYPRLGHDVTVASAAADPSDLRAVAIALAIGAALLAPTLWLLLRAAPGTRL